MSQVLIKKEKSISDTPVFGVIELSEGEGYYLAEFSNIPVEPHLPQTYEFFDDDETIESLQQKYQLDLSDFELVPFELSE